MRTRLKKIIEISKPRLITLGLAIGFNVTLAGTVCGTFAWYTYATRAGFKSLYHGTTASTMGYLEIGLVSDYYLTDFNKYNLTLDTDFSSEYVHKYVYWCKGNNLRSDAINAIAKLNGYGSTIIEPTTSGSDDAISTYGFHLYRKPTHNNEYKISPEDYALKTSYVNIPFIFRTFKSDGQSSGINSSVYLVGANLYTSNDEFDNGELHKAVRFYINQYNNSYIVAPSYNDDGTNDVGGILDLDLNGFYDYKEDKKEIVYGEHEGTYTYEEEPRTNSTTVPKDEITSFFSNHKEGVYALDENSFVPKTVSYEGISKFFSRQYPIAVPDYRYNGLSYGEITIYLEGWDKHVVDQEQESRFNLNLSFSS